MRTFSLSFVLLFAVACSSSPKSEPTEPTGPATTDPATTDPATTDPATTDPAPADDGAAAWAALSTKEKAKIMKEKVVPAVAAIWKESPEPDEEVNCVTCHGQGATKGEFTMPSKSIPTLDPTDSFAKHQDEAEWLEFMSKKLVPTVAGAIGVPTWSPDNQTGFGCFNCHGKSGQ